MGIDGTVLLSVAMIHSAEGWQGCIEVSRLFGISILSFCFSYSITSEFKDIKDTLIIMFHYFAGMIRTQGDFQKSMVSISKEANKSQTNNRES